MRRLVQVIAVWFCVGGSLAAGQGLPTKVSPTPNKPLIGGQTCGEATADVSALLIADQAFSDATAARGLEGFLSFMADDVATLRPDQPVLTGKKALADTWTPLLTNPALSIRWKPLTGSISVGGDLGYTIGSYEITRSDDQGRRVTSTGKYVTIWRRQADGAWKVAFDSGVPDSPPKP
jgi:ketosteroid isomerase-like protein